MSSKLKLNDSVVCVARSHDSTSKHLTIGKTYSILETKEHSSTYQGPCVKVYNDSGNIWWAAEKNFKLNISKGEDKFMDSFKEYLKEHKSIFFTIGAILVIDHLVLGGALREKVKEILNKLLGKVEKQLDIKGE